LIISEIQNKLATWSSEDKTRRFNRILRLITNRIWLQEAARITLASSGANTPGVDNMNKEKNLFRTYLNTWIQYVRSSWLVRINHNLLSVSISPKLTVRKGQ